MNEEGPSVVDLRDMPYPHLPEALRVIRNPEAADVAIVDRVAALAAAERSVVMISEASPFAARDALDAVLQPRSPAQALHAASFPAPPSARLLITAHETARLPMLLERQSGGLFASEHLVGLALAAPRLTAEERMLADLLADGRPVEQIMRRCGLSRASVYRKTTRLMELTGTLDRPTLAALLGRLGAGEADRLTECDRQRVG